MTDVESLCLHSCIVQILEILAHYLYTLYCTALAGYSCHLIIPAVCQPGLVIILIKWQETSRYFHYHSSTKYQLLSRRPSGPKRGKRIFGIFSLRKEVQIGTEIMLKYEYNQPRSNILSQKCLQRRQYPLNPALPARVKEFQTKSTFFRNKFRLPF